jgi:hypothetical protein
MNGRRIGAAFERRIATDLRKWLGEDYTVTRNPTDRQGGQDGRSFGEFSVDGPRRFPFVVECKAERAFSLRMLFRDPLPSLISTYWEQAARQAGQAFTSAMSRHPSAHRSRSPYANGAHPLLIVRERHYPIVCMMRYATSQAFKRAYTIAVERPQMRPIMRVVVHAEEVDAEELDVWRWDDLMKIDSMCLGEL